MFEQDAKTLHHTYRKWQGPHWTLTCPAMIDYPGGGERLRPLVRRVNDWLFSKHFLQPPMTAVLPGQGDRVRHCASMDGNAIWCSVRCRVGRSPEPRPALLRSRKHHEPGDPFGTMARQDPAART